METSHKKIKIHLLGLFRLDTEGLTCKEFCSILVAILLFAGTFMAVALLLGVLPALIQGIKVVKSIWWVLSG
ncbi:hypothetical protein [Chitinophaga cymbidii]|nr:hypothetical protein [Chitinophaga cymbidii]